MEQTKDMNYKVTDSLSKTNYINGIGFHGTEIDSVNETDNSCRNVFEISNFTTDLIRLLVNVFCKFKRENHINFDDRSEDSEIILTIGNELPRGRKTKAESRVEEMPTNVRDQRIRHRTYIKVPKSLINILLPHYLTKKNNSHCSFFIR